MFEKLLFINEQKHEVKIDSSRLNFSDWIFTPDNDPEKVDKFCKINEDILENDVAFQESLEKYDHMLLSNTYNEENIYLHQHSRM